MIPALMGKKKALGIILGFGDEKSPEPEEESGGEDESLRAVAEDFIRAVVSKDAAAAADAFRAAYCLLEAEEHKEEEY